MLKNEKIKIVTVIVIVTRYVTVTVEKSLKSDYCYITVTSFFDDVIAVTVTITIT